MTFKTYWEKTHTQHHLTDDLIQQMLGAICPDNQIKGFETIDGGCANVNIKVELESVELPLILRVYLRDPQSAYKEQKLAQKLKGKVLLPQIYRIAEISGYTFAIAEFMPGITLRDFLLNDKECNTEQIMFKVGNILACIASNKFDRSGLFNETLEVSEFISQDVCIRFFQDALNDQNIKSVLDKEQCKKIEELIKIKGHLFPEGLEKNLVHADFDPANIIVNKINGQTEVSGILDWEFSFSGSTLSDIANMLRYAHRMPKSYETSFLKGLTTSGYRLPENWRTKINMLNLLSLLDCIKRSDPKNQPNRISDIRELISHILLFFSIES